ncbi:MAG: hypothetical protein ABUS49_12990 [Acidobacteriota bacterium]
MASDKQIAASRANGAKSRGPVTPEGKRRSSRKSLHDALIARVVVLEAESRERFNALLVSLQQELQPETAIENLLVQKMAVAHWRQMRVWGMEKAGIAHDARTVGVQSAEIQDPATRDAIAFRVSSTRIGDSEMRFDRQFSRALDRFEKFRAARRDGRNRDSGAPNPVTA